MQIKAKKLTRDFYVVLSISLAVVLVMVGATVYLRVTAPKDDGTYIPKSTEITPEIRLLQDYVRLDTRTGQETPGALFLRDVLRKNGVEAEIIESAPGRPNVYARIRGRQPGGGLLLLHHIDVVGWNLDGWTHGPFSGDIDQNQLWGRGALDMKSIGICSSGGLPRCRPLAASAGARSGVSGRQRRGSERISRDGMAGRTPSGHLLGNLLWCQRGWDHRTGARADEVFRHRGRRKPVHQFRSEASDRTPTRSVGGEASGGTAAKRSRQDPPGGPGVFPGDRSRSSGLSRGAAGRRSCGGGWLLARLPATYRLLTQDTVATGKITETWIALDDASGGQHLPDEDPDDVLNRIHSRYGS